MKRYLLGMHLKKQANCQQLKTNGNIMSKLKTCFGKTMVVCLCLRRNLFCSTFSIDSFLSSTPYHQYCTRVIVVFATTVFMQTIEHYISTPCLYCTRITVVCVTTALMQTIEHYISTPCLYCTRITVVCVTTALMQTIEHYFLHM